MMLKRHAYFSALASEFNSLEEFAKANDEWLAIMGIEFRAGDSYHDLYIQLDFTEYECYHVVPGDDGKLTVSHVIWWQDFTCANSLLNIFTGKEADEEDILTCY